MLDLSSSYQLLVLSMLECNWYNLENNFRNNVKSASKCIQIFNVNA